jgi:cytochrome c oxidase assembly protein subunit 15
MDFTEGFQFWRNFGVPEQSWGLSSKGRVAVQVVHRLGAVVTLVYVGVLSICLVRARQHVPLAIAGGATLALLLTQVSIGIANVLLALPLPLAVAHNGVAALLLLSLVTVYHTLRLPPVSM